MNGTTNRMRLATLALAATAALAVAACGGGDAGRGQGRRLRLAGRAATGQHQRRARLHARRRVLRQACRGAVPRQPPHQGRGSVGRTSPPTPSSRSCSDVAAGEIDLGWAGTRVFDTLDVKSFQALTAPMLVDSYALESAVIESGITEQMMQGLDGLGVAGLGVLADGLRKPIGVTGPDPRPGGLAGDHVRHAEVEWPGRSDPSTRGHAGADPRIRARGRARKTGRSRDSRSASGSTSATPRWRISLPT